MRTRRRRIVIAALLTLASPALLAAVSAPSYAQTPVRPFHSAGRAITIDPGDPGLWLGWGFPTYSADFTQNLDTTRWSLYNGTTATPFPFSKANVSVSGGALHLTGQLDGPVVNGKAHDEGAGVQSSTNATYGRWEARIRVAQGGGYGAAMTLWPHSGVWPDDGEIDVTEVHDPNRTKAAQLVHLGPKNKQVGTTSLGDWSGWHVYGVDWEANYIKYYIDGRLTYTVTDPAMIPSTPMHATLQLNQACNTWVGCRDATTPAVVSMDVDWMRYYAVPAL